jgi:hypothetical protein
MDLQKRLMGMKDPRGLEGIFSRGKNVYNSASSSAQSGGGQQYGRPPTKDPRRDAIARRMKKIGGGRAFIG